ncbi:MAG: hypothetical protein IJ733_08200 [Lachnospiraceae bacterium]|nr:hypothetical protein [Lachnospiraceae bacterium]
MTEEGETDEIIYKWTDTGLKMGKRINEKAEGNDRFGQDGYPFLRW